MTVACPSRVSFLAQDPLSCSAVSLPDPGGPLLYPASIPAPCPCLCPARVLFALRPTLRACPTVCSVCPVSRPLTRADRAR